MGLFPNEQEKTIGTSVIKRVFGEYIKSKLVNTQNREISFKYMAYNPHRLTYLTIIIDGFNKV